jgi:hypothetical protein
MEDDVKLEALSRDDRIFGGIGLLLVIDLLALPWLSYSVGPFSADSAATGYPDGWLGVLAVLAVIVVLVDLAIERFSPQTTLPMIRGSRAETRFIVACVAAVFLLLKFLFNIHFSNFGFGFWAGIVLTAAFVYFALQARTVTAVGAPLA